MCPEEIVELSGLVELPVVELTGADCINMGGVNGGCPPEWSN